MIVLASVSSATLVTITVSPSTTTGCFLVFFVVAARATSCAVARLPIWRCRTSTACSGRVGRWGPLRAAQPGLPPAHRRVRGDTTRPSQLRAGVRQHFFGFVAPPRVGRGGVSGGQLLVRRSRARRRRVERPGGLDRRVTRPLALVVPDLPPALTFAPFTAAPASRTVKRTSVFCPLRSFPGCGGGRPCSARWDGARRRGGRRPRCAPGRPGPCSPHPASSPLPWCGVRGRSHRGGGDHGNGDNASLHDDPGTGFGSRARIVQRGTVEHLDLVLRRRARDAPYAM